MKVYPDANIYVTYLLGQKGEALCDRFFKQGIGCRFSLVASNTMFAEVAQRCGRSSLMLFQKNIDDYKKVRKLEVIAEKPAIFSSADELNRKTGRKYGLNDITHVLLASENADVFVTSDRNLATFASKYVKAVLLESFVESEF